MCLPTDCWAFVRELPWNRLPYYDRLGLPLCVLREPWNQRAPSITRGGWGKAIVSSGNSLTPGPSSGRDLSSLGKKSMDVYQCLWKCCLERVTLYKIVDKRLPTVHNKKHVIGVVDSPIAQFPDCVFPIGRGYLRTHLEATKEMVNFTMLSTPSASSLVLPREFALI